MDLSHLQPAAGSRKNRKRIGRGPGSGLGKTAGKGHKGQNARSGGGVKAGFEGGQMPMQRRLPKRGFIPLQKTVYALIKLQDLDRYFEAGSVVGPDQLRQAGLTGSKDENIKVLADGTLSKALTVKAHKFSKAAAEKIVSAGGQAEVI